MIKSPLSRGIITKWIIIPSTTNIYTSLSIAAYSIIPCLMLPFDSENKAGNLHIGGKVRDKSACHGENR